MIIDTAVGPIILDRTGDPASAHLTYRGEEYVFPEPYNGDPDLPVGPFLNGVSGAVVRSLAGKAAFVWHANDDLRLVFREAGDRVHVERNPELDRALEHLACSLQDEVRPEILLREFEVIADGFGQPVIWRAGHTRLHTHHTRAEQRREYLGNLAALGGVSLSSILPALGYVEVPVLPLIPVPADFLGTEWDRDMPSYTRRNEPSTAWVKPEYRATSRLVEQLAVAMEIPASHTATGVSSLEIAYDELDAVDREFGFAFVAGLRFTSSGVTIAAVNEIIDLENPDVRRDLPDLLREIRERGGRTIRFLIPRLRRELATLAGDDDTLLRLVALHAADDPTHAVTPERFAKFPSPAEHRARSAYIHTKQQHQSKSLPSYIHPEFDEEAFRTAVLRYLQRDAPDAGHPLLEAAKAFAEGARTDLVPFLDQALEEGAAAVRPAREALIHAVDLLSSLGVEDLERRPARGSSRREFPPMELMPPPLSWDPVGSEERSWEAVLLTFALTRTGEAALVPAPLVAALTHRPEPVSLPVSWEWRVDAFRFVSVAIARDVNAGQHALGKVLVAGLDARRGSRIAVVVKESEWPCLVSAIATYLGTTVGNPEKVANYLRRSADLVEEIPDAHDHVFGRAYELWLPDLSNRSRLVVLERSPAIDIIAEENEFEQYAPRMRASLRRWSRLRPVFADEFFLGGADVEWYGEFQRFPLLTIPQACAESAEEAVELEVVTQTIVPLYLAPLVATGEPDDAQARAAVWLREVDRELRLEHGVWEVVGSVVVRILGAVAPEADVPAERLGYGYEQSAVVLRPGRLPRQFYVDPDSLTVFLQRSAPLSNERGPLIRKWGVSSATLLEAYREGGSYSQAARVLGSWGLNVSSGSIGTEIRRVQAESPALYAAVVGQELQ